MGGYGVDGSDIAGGPQSPANGTLTYGSYAVQKQSSWTWATSTSDKRALEVDGQGNRTAATWYGSGTFSFDVNFTDKNSHQVALYVLDWDSKGRGESIQVVDAGNAGNVLDTRRIPDTDTLTSATNFSNGTYLVWSIAGHVTINITTTAGPNGVVAGIFFASRDGHSAHPRHGQLDRQRCHYARQLDWEIWRTGIFAGQCRTEFRYPGDFCSDKFRHPWTWAISLPADARDLETDTLGHQIAAAWYSASPFQLDLNLTDGSTHQVALYVLDWDKKGRAEAISIVDANSGAVLDSGASPARIAAPQPAISRAEPI